MFYSLSAGLWVTMAHACGFPVGWRVNFLLLTVQFGGVDGDRSVSQASNFSTRGNCDIETATQNSLLSDPLALFVNCEFSDPVPLMDPISVMISLSKNITVYVPKRARSGFDLFISSSAPSS